VRLASARKPAARAQTISTSRKLMVAKPISHRVSVDKLRRRNS
jgi:hypothetical protein